MSVLIGLQFRAQITRFLPANETEWKKILKNGRTVQNRRTSPWPLAPVVHRGQIRVAHTPAEVAIWRRRQASKTRGPPPHLPLWLSAAPGQPAWPVWQNRPIYKSTSTMAARKRSRYHTWAHINPVVRLVPRRISIHRQHTTKIVHDSTYMPHVT